MCREIETIEIATPAIDENPMYEQDIFELTRNRALTAMEIHHPNDFYGNAHTLKRFLGIEQGYPLKCVIAHSVFPNGHWEKDLEAPLPVLLSPSAASIKTLAGKTDKYVFPIGPVIAYAQRIFPDEEIKRLKAGLGRNLLVFLPHSTHYIATKYDLDYVINHIADVGKAFDSVSVSIYWKDCTEELVNKCRSHGFQCVTAGHMYDPLFLYRLRTLFELSDAVLSYDTGTACGYAVYFNKPLMVSALRLDQKTAYQNIPMDLSVEEGRAFKKIMLSSFKEFSQPTTLQMAHLEYVFGFKDTRAALELGLIIKKAEELYWKNREE